jgi:type IV secretory pathway TrbL component
MWKNFKKALIIAIAIVVVMWAWKKLKDDESTQELLNRIKKLTNA